jgi:hypothetical protein
VSLLDDARRLAQDIHDVNAGACNHCTGHGGEHCEWCPTLSMPTIIAALEAAHALTEHMLPEEVFPARQALSRIMRAGKETSTPTDTS